MTLGLASRRPLSIALGLLVLTFLYGCQAGEQGESQPDETTAQDQASEDMGQIQAATLTEHRESWGRRSQRP